MEEIIQISLWEEGNKEGVYDSLFPSNMEGKIIFWLYEAIQESRIESDFLQIDLDDAIRAAKPVINRNQIQDNRNIIHKLQKYFLWYNPYTRTYSLRIHATKFCELAKETLQKGEKSKIEIICKRLNESLNESNFSEWKDYDFETSKHEFKKEIESLDNKINSLIEELRTKRNSEEDFLYVLISISEKLEQIQKEYEKLKAAFDETKNIKLKLEKIRNDISDEDLKNQSQKIIDFFKEVRERLEGVNVRIMNIQPRIRQQINLFSRPGFAYRIDKFIHYILEKSTVKNQTLSLPTGIVAFPIGITRGKFIGLETWKEPPPPIIREPFKMTDTERRKAFEGNLKRLELQTNASLLLKEFDKELNIRGELLLSQYFSKILNNDWVNFKLAVKFSYLLIKKYDMSKFWQLEVLPQKLVYKTLKSTIELWEIRIYKKV